MLGHLEELVYKPSIFELLSLTKVEVIVVQVVCAVACLILFAGIVYSFVACWKAVKKKKKK